MDFTRPSPARRRRRRQIVFVAGGIVLIALVTMGLARLKARRADRRAFHGLDRHRQARLSAAAGARSGNAGSRRDSVDSGRSLKAESTRFVSFRELR